MKTSDRRHAWLRSVNLAHVLCLGLLVGCPEFGGLAVEDGAGAPRVVMSGVGEGLVAFARGYRIQRFRHIAATPYEIAAGLGSVSNLDGILGRNRGEFVGETRAAMNLRGDAIVTWWERSGRGRTLALLARRHASATGYGEVGVVVELGGLDPIQRTSSYLQNAEVAMDAAGNALAVWKQGSRLYAATQAPDQPWSESLLVGSTDAMGAIELSMNEAGEALIVSARAPASNSNVNALDAHHFDFATGFGPSISIGAVKILMGTTIGLPYDVAIDDAGDGVAVYTDPTNKLQARRFDAGLGWLEPEHVAFGTEPRVDLDDAGNGLLVYSTLKRIDAIPYREGRWLTEHVFPVLDPGYAAVLSVAPGGDAISLVQDQHVACGPDCKVGVVAYRRFSIDEFDASTPGSGWQDAMTIGSSGFNTRAANQPYTSDVPFLSDLAMESGASAIAVWTELLPNNEKVGALRTFVWAPPEVVFSAAPGGLEVDFDASASRARTTDRVIARYDWDFEDDGAFDALGVVTSHVYPVEGAYDVRLRVTDTEGISAARVETILVGAAPPGDVALILQLEGDGGGGVTSSPPGIDCGAGGSACDAGFQAGGLVVLTAAPDAGSVFGGFGGDPDCDDGMLTLDLDTLCTARFDAVGGDANLSVRLVLAGDGTVTTSPPGIDCGDLSSDCDEAYPLGSVVTLIPTPAPGSVFVGWNGDPECAQGHVTMDGPKFCEAVFDLAVSPSQLSLRIIGISGNGRVTSSEGGISCGIGTINDCAQIYPITTDVLLSAIALPGSSFAGWLGDCSSGGSSAQIIVPMLDDTRCEATFSLEGGGE